MEEEEEATEIVDHVPAEEATELMVIVDQVLMEEEKEEEEAMVIVDQVPMEAEEEATELTVIVDQVPMEEEAEAMVIVDQVLMEEEEATELTVIVDQVPMEEEEATELMVRSAVRGIFDTTSTFCDTFTCINLLCFIRIRSLAAYFELA